MSLKNAAVLIIDDDVDILTAVRLLLKGEVKEVVTEKNPENIRSILSRQSFDVILLDMNYNSSINTGNEGFYWLGKIRVWSPDAAVIMITAYADIDLAIRSLKEGAADFMVKPWHNDKLLSTISTVLRNTNGRVGDGKAAKAPPPAVDLLGESLPMQEIFYKVQKIAPTDANILILGENGTGKDGIAKAIHQQSMRAHKPFIKVDIGALTDSLFESELFGHKKGAFTDAREDREGLIEAANGGTLFLNEIGNITLYQQAKLLSVLQNREVTRLGSNNPVPVDIRLVCATNVPMSELANELRFRKDLIYRINTVEIIMPPLRKRGKDIILLANYFNQTYSNKYLKSTLQFTPAAMEKLLAYPFPGNVRELQYAVERAVIMSDGAELDAADIIFSPIEAGAAGDTTVADTNLGALEKSTILAVIEKHGGNISKAAKELGITRTALYRRLNKYDI